MRSRRDLRLGNGLTNYLVSTKLPAMAATAIPWHHPRHADVGRRATGCDRRGRDRGVRDRRPRRRLDRGDRPAGRRLPAVRVPAVRNEEGALPRRRPELFRPTRLAFEAAAATWWPGDPDPVRLRSRGDGPGLQAPPRQPDAPARPAPGLRGVLRSRRPRPSSARSSARLHRRVREISGASPEDLHPFFAQGMLLNLGAAIGLPGRGGEPGPSKTWRAASDRSGPVGPLFSAEYLVTTNKQGDASDAPADPRRLDLRHQLDRPVHGGARQPGRHDRPAGHPGRASTHRSASSSGSSTPTP